MKLNTSLFSDFSEYPTSKEQKENIIFSIDDVWGDFSNLSKKLICQSDEDPIKIKITIDRIMSNTSFFNNEEHITPK